MTDERLETRVGDLLKARGQTITTAESCTGGLILHRLTNIAGSSAYVLGGIVAYSNEAKVKFLGVQEETLMRHGAVSEPTAREMARGVRALFGTDFALSVTGIAGPGGGTPEKPVGLTYIGLCVLERARYRDGVVERIQVIRRVWEGDRETNKADSASAALELLHDYLLENPINS